MFFWSHDVIRACHFGSNSRVLFHLSERFLERRDCKFGPRNRYEESEPSHLISWFRYC